MFDWIQGFTYVMPCYPLFENIDITSTASQCLTYLLEKVHESKLGHPEFSTQDV